MKKQKNIYIRKMLDLAKRVKSLPIGKLLKENSTFLKGTYATDQLSDVLRYYLLYKFGGIYIDLDTITIAAIPDEFPDNFGVALTDAVASAVLRFRKNHPLLKTVLDLMAKNWNDGDRLSIGPRLLTGAYFTYCDYPQSTELQAFTRYPSKTKFLECQTKQKLSESASILNTMYAYGVEYSAWQRSWAPFNEEDLLDVSKTKDILTKYQKDGAVWSHLYFSQTKNLFKNVRHISGTAISLLFFQNCPITFIFQ